jgi:plastocyanin domain-containing protein
MKTSNIIMLGVILSVLALGTAVFYITYYTNKNNSATQTTSPTGFMNYANNQKQSGQGMILQEVKLGFQGYNYYPSKIIVKKDMPVKIIADTDQIKGCFRSIVIPDMGISKRFTDRDNTLEFTPTKAGTYPFSCSMGMAAGVIVVM